MTSFVAILVACVIAAAIAQPLPPSSSSAPVEKFSCEGLEVGQHAAAMNACESYFFQCSEGYLYGIRLNCTELTYFDTISKQCLFASDVEACGGVATTTTTHSSLSSSTGQQTTSGQEDEGEKFDCGNKMDDIYASESNKCSSVFWSCTNGNAHMHACPAQLKFDIVSKACLESDYITACGGQSTTTDSPTTKAPINDTIFETACMSLQAGYYSDPREEFKTDNGAVCSQVFMVCTGSSPAALAYECPADLYYDASITACNYHSETPACTGAPLPSTGLNLQTVKVAPEGTCDDKIAGNYDVKNGTCAREYVACTNDATGWIFTCPSELYFDVEFNRCDYKEFIPICDGTRPDWLTTTTEAETTTEVEITTEAPPAVRRR